MKCALWIVIVLGFIPVYGLADSVTPHVVPTTVITTDLSTATLNPGGTLAVSIKIGGITNLASFQFSFSFNPSVLSATSVSAGTFFPGGTFSAGTINNGNG